MQGRRPGEAGALGTAVGVRAREGANEPHRRGDPQCRHQPGKAQAGASRVPEGVSRMGPGDRVRGRGQWDGVSGWGQWDGHPGRWSQGGCRHEAGPRKARTRGTSCFLRGTSARPGPAREPALRAEPPGARFKGRVCAFAAERTQLGPRSVPERAGS